MKNAAAEATTGAVFDLLTIRLCIYCAFVGLQCWSACRYMLGDDGQSLYMVFMGTKHMRDLISDANFLQEAVWKSKEPDKQSQVISTSLHHASAWQSPLLPYLMLDTNLCIALHAMCCKTSQGVLARLELLSLCSMPLLAVTFVALRLTSTHPVHCHGQYAKLSCLHSGNSSCSQRLSGQSTPHSRGSPVQSC